ncbi:gamma-glutamyl-gamma-aminobutyrate hydrolase family protein [Micromonospora endolithica]|uniref:Gamma-glutamyl-gamma-aminobutyrate hydrolase family protein n=1 Tax=Micromonospora endolithica TaxID=230091 RepID=A0A3A9ZLS9_9ACTN|nr:gamma-glutamyl-gamma-aminobutyrate hydrolase family protein [Micromonospora endolithica]RKN49281.1 gamma-glutamyl-gamma-aminobutyrate hydrolase family protein [Micromonospora endolithica]TWJ23461.1 putative glutamine amidotransferase [Micromonospora endolithica]
MTRPVIGITAYAEPASWAVWRDVPAVLVPEAYVRAVTAAGGRAVVLPPDDRDPDVLDVLDGLLLAGGADVDPARYGQLPAPRTESRPVRDAGELTLVTAALGTDLPVLGVCRGMQLLAVATGGALHQHLPDVVGHDGHRPAPGVYGDHPARFVPGSLAGRVMAGVDRVNSYHHQALADPGRLTVTGWSDDGVVEAVEDPDRPFLLGVQWHPENEPDPRAITALVRAAAAHTRPTSRPHPPAVPPPPHRHPTSI